MHNDIWCVRWDLSLIWQRRKLRFSEVEQHAHSPSLDAKQTLWTQWLAGVLVFHSLPPNVLEVQPGIFFLLNFPFLPPKVLIPCCCRCAISENVCFICSYHRFQNGNSSPSQRSSLQRVTMKRLSHMTCPSMVHPGGRAGALRGGVQVLPAQRRVLESEGLLLPESMAQVRTGWPQSTGPLVWRAAETYSRRNPPARRGSGRFTTVYVSDAFGVPAWMLLDSAQKCDRREVCWPRDTRPL